MRYFPCFVALIFSGTVAVFALTKYLLDATEDSFFCMNPRGVVITKWYDGGRFSALTGSEGATRSWNETENNNQQPHTSRNYGFVNINPLEYNNTNGVLGTRTPVMQSEINTITRHSTYFPIGDANSDDAKMQTTNNTHSNVQGFNISPQTSTGELLTALKNNRHMNDTLFRVGIEPELVQSIRGVWSSHYFTYKIK